MGFLWHKKEKQNNNIDVTPEEQQLAEQEKMREDQAKHDELRRKNTQTQQKKINTDNLSNHVTVVDTKENNSSDVPDEAVPVSDSPEEKQTIGTNNIPANDFAGQSGQEHLPNSYVSKGNYDSAASSMSLSDLVNSEINSHTTNDNTSLRATHETTKQAETNEDTSNRENGENKEYMSLQNSITINASQSNHLRLVPTDDDAQTTFEVDAAFADWFINDVISLTDKNTVADIEGHKCEAISYLTSVYLLTSGYSNNNTKKLDNGGFLTEYSEYIRDNIYYLIQAILAYNGNEDNQLGTTWSIVNSADYLHRLSLMAFEGPEAVNKKHADYKRAIQNFISTVADNDITINYVNEE